MVKNNTIDHTVSHSSLAESFIPARQALRDGQLRCLGGARVLGHSGRDRYLRPPSTSWLIELVIAGAGHVEQVGQSYHPQAGDLYLFAPHSHGSYQPDDTAPWEKLFIEVEGAFIDALGTAYQLHQQVLYPQAQLNEHMHALLHILTLNNTHFQREFPLALHRLVSAIVSQQHAHTENMCAFIETYVKKEFKLQDLADHVEYSKNHALRLFKAENDCSPYEYLMRKRIEQAIWSLTHTPLSVKQIAAELCFSDSKHLSSTLKKRSGKSPREWRDWRKQRKQQFL